MSASRNEGPAFCAKCGAELVPGSSFCWKCGAPVEGARVSIETKEAPKKPWYFSRPVLILTLLFLTPVWAILILADKRQGKGVKILASLIGLGYLLYCGYLVVGTSSISSIEGNASRDLRVESAFWKTGEFGIRYVAGTVVNTGKKTYGYVQVEINLYDEQGNQVGSTLANVNNLEPGGRWKFEAIVMEDNASRFKVKGVTGF